MPPRRPLRPRCLFLGLISAWVVAIYVPSLILAATGLAPAGAGRNILSATWDIADEVAPFAKIGYAFALSVLLLGARRLGLRRPALTVADIILACIAMLLVLALLPSGWSRGFGVGLGGARFAPAATLIYLIGAVLSGLTFSLADAKCRNRDYPEDGAA